MHFSVFSCLRIIFVGLMPLLELVPGPTLSNYTFQKLVYEPG